MRHLILLTLVGATLGGCGLRKDGERRAVVSPPATGASSLVGEEKESHGGDLFAEDIRDRGRFLVQLFERAPNRCGLTAAQLDRLRNAVEETRVELYRDDSLSKWPIHQETIEDAQRPGKMELRIHWDGWYRASVEAAMTDNGLTEFVLFRYLTVASLSSMNHTLRVCLNDQRTTYTQWVWSRQSRPIFPEFNVFCRPLSGKRFVMSLRRNEYGVRSLDLFSDRGDSLFFEGGYYCEDDSSWRTLVCEDTASRSAGYRVTLVQRGENLEAAVYSKSASSFSPLGMSSCPTAERILNR